MDDATRRPPELESRPPEQRDLVALCARLNELGARYLICGGFAIIHAGYLRLTGDVDVLMDPSLENEAKVFQALESLPDRAVRELNPGEVAEYTVVRVADEITVDLMASASGISFADAEREIVIREVDGVRIPFASPLLLWRMKSRTHREKDRADLVFLNELFRSQGVTPGN